MRESLLPCPFCGGEPEEDAGGCIEYYGHERQDYCISCNRCGAEVYCAVGTFEKADAPCSCHHDTRKICVDKWNMRHIAAPAVQAEQLSGNTEHVSQPYKLPDGYALVPVELTTDMRAAWDSAPNTDDDDHNMQAAYRAMVAAAPDFREIPNSSTNNCRENADSSTKCWIPVSERMPDETQPVIVVSEGGVVQRTVYQFCEGVWIDWYEQYDEVPPDAFTHWMPLPNPPKQEGE